jgi:ethanolamine utilization protein EutQ
MTRGPLVADAPHRAWEPLGIEDAGLAEIKPLVTVDESSTLGAGLCRFDRCSFPWQLSYDECIYVIDGRMEVEHDGKTIVAESGDVAFVPSGSSVTYSFPRSCLLFYAAYPVDWQEHLEVGSRG